MSKQSKLRAGGSRLVRAAMACVLAVGLMPLPAFADDLAAATLAPQDATAMDTTTGVIGDAYAAANPAPEILGLNNPDQRSTGEADQTYNFFGDPEINENPNPFLYNYKNGLTPGVYIGGHAGSPMSALKDYSTTDPQAAQNAIWELLPDVILGTGNDNIPANEHDFYNTDVNARAVETALGLDANSYNPIGVTYNRSNLSTMIATMYRLAAAANEAAAATGKTTRYGDPLAIAQNYERYILGQKGLVLQAIASGKVAKRTIALVQSYDSEAKTYTIITDGVAEGTATTNRYLEAVQGVANNYYDVVGEQGATSVTAQQLKDNVDVIILGTASGTDQTDSIASYLLQEGLLDKTFYCVNWANGSAFGTTVNSVENAQNVGRILPCVYPEVLDQSDMVAYYYDTFYHLKDGVIAELIAERMDGVRNWNNSDSASYTAWEVSDVSGYNSAKVQALLVNGVGYLNAQSASVPSYLVPSANLAGDTASYIDISGYGSQLKKLDTDWGYTGNDITAINANISLSSDLGKMVEGVDYTVAYKDAAGATLTYPKEIGTYTMVVTGIGLYTGSFNFTVNVVPYFSVYKQTGTDDPVLVYTFKSKADFVALANITSTDYVSGLYYKGGWNVSTAKTYVTLDAVIEAAGLTAVWTDDAKINYGGDPRQAKASNTFTKAELDQLMFYPSATAEESYTTPAVKAPFVFAIEEYSALIGADQKASDVQASNVQKANANTAPRSVLGVSEADFKAKGGTTAAGKRLWSNITAITIISDPVDISKAEVALDPTSFVYDGKAKEPAVTVTLDGTTLKAGADYAVVYENNTEVGTAKAVVTGQGFFTGQTEATFTIEKAEPAEQTLKFKTPQSANVKFKKLKSANQTVAIDQAKGAQTTVTYSIAKVSKSAKSFSINKKNGKITVKKGLAKGTYKVTVKADAAASDAYKAATAKAVIKVKVK